MSKARITYDDGTYLELNNINTTKYIKSRYSDIITIQKRYGFTSSGGKYIDKELFYNSTSYFGTFYARYNKNIPYVILHRIYNYNMEIRLEYLNLNTDIGFKIFAIKDNYYGISLNNKYYLVNSFVELLIVMDLIIEHMHNVMIKLMREEATQNGPLLREKLISFFKENKFEL